jgi:type IV pilus assembly protein PilE
LNAQRAAATDLQPITQMKTPREQGSTLIDICAACAMGSIVTALALPSYHDYVERARRDDAVLALQRVQQAQEQFHAQHARYATQLNELAGVQRTSDRGLYRISMFSDATHSFEARAVAVPGGAQTKDPGCAQVTLRVTHALISYEPSMRCWMP